MEAILGAMPDLLFELDMVKFIIITLEALIF
jgi:hypothetical protein